jgi:FKBP-type peptidyl-prolyl cis-trans isomerase
MSARNNGQRILIWIIVGVFFISSLSLSFFVVYETFFKKDTSTASTNEDVQKQLEELQKNQSQEGKLEGTKLANFTPIAKVDTLQKIDLQEGTGAVVQPGATVTAHYTGALASDGTIFQSSLDRGQPIPFSLNQVIKGWTEGVPGMKEGGKRRLIIPAEQAYGAQSPSPNIPANSDLVFDIEIVKIGE